MPALALSAEIVPGDHDFLAGRRRHHDRRHRPRDRLVPGGADLLDRAAHADRIDLRRGRQRADRDRHVEAASIGADDVGEQEGAALILIEAALELPAHQRVEFGVLVDLAIDAHQESGGFEPRQVVLEVGRRAAALGRLGRLIRALIGRVKHRDTSRQESSSLYRRKRLATMNAINTIFRLVPRGWRGGSSLGSTG